MTHDAAKLTGLLGQAHGVPQLAAAAREFARHTDFGHFLYAVRVPMSPSPPVHFALSGFPKQWRELYDKNGYLRIDPIVQHAFASSIPVVWDEVSRPNDLIRNFFAQAASVGLAHGVSTPVCGRRSEIGLFSLARELPITADAADRLALKQQMIWFGTVLHEAVMRVAFTKPQKQSQQQLSSREKECLLYASEGMSSSNIAEHMNITERTVLFHLETAGQKLGVRGRHNIVSSAISSGELTLSHQALDTVRPIPQTSEYAH